MKNTMRRTVSAAIVLILMVFALTFQVIAASSGSVDGLSITRTGSAGDITTGTHSATLTVKKSWSVGGGSAEDTFTITNPSTNTKDLKVTFNYATSGTVTSVKATGVAENTGSKCAVTLKPGGSFTIYLKTTASKLSSATATFSITDLVVEEVLDSAQLTVNFDAALGGVKANGTAVSAGDVITVTKDGVTLTTVPASGKQFIAWVDGTGKVVSLESAYTYKPAEAEMTLKAVFASDAPVFFVDGGKTIVEGWTEAMKYSGVVALANNATLTEGTYTVPSGVTFLVPYNGGLTASVEKPVWSTPVANPPAPTAYKTLTLMSGAKIVVNGIMTVPAEVYAGDTSAGLASTMVKNSYGHVVLNSGSSITVNSGAKLSAFGYITGSGDVIANSGATVYEGFQIMGFRGGSALSGMAVSKKAFPLSQYYIQNIEAPLTLHYGANEIAYVALYMDGSLIDSSAAFIGKSGNLFNLTSGYLVKRYNKASDRLMVDIHGNLDVDKFSITIKYIIDYPIKSSDFVMPITNNMTIDIHNGATVNINANMSMLPGAEINIHKGGTMKMASGKSMYLYDRDEWVGKGYIYPAEDLRPLAFVPDRVKTRTAADLKDAQITVEGTLDASVGKLYTSTGGAAIKGIEGGLVKVVDGGTTTDKQATQNGTSISYVDVPMNSAWLHHGNESYLTNGAGDYYYINGFWHLGNACSGGEPIVENNVDPTCGAAGSYDSVVYCTVCNGLVSRDTVTVDALGHTAVSDANPNGDPIASATPATCTDAGVEFDYWKCTREGCGVYYKVENDTQIVVEENAWVSPALGHEYTVSENGYTWANDYSKVTASGVCSRDESHIGEIDSINVTSATTDATCSAPGETVYTATFAENTEWKNLDTQTAKVELPINKNAHEWDNDCDTTCNNDESHTREVTHAYGDWVVTTEPTCEGEGVQTKTCPVCGDKQTQAVQAKGHSYTSEETKAPTCTEKGEKTYTCACGDTYTEEIAATGHTLTQVDAKAPTCTEAGYEAYEYCSVCDYTTYKEVAATGHSYEEVVTAPTCTEKGYTTYTCACGDTYVDNYVDAKGHSYTSEETKAPTCTEKGEKTYTCACGDTYTEEIEAQGHDMVNVDGKPATCTEEGYTAYRDCTRCDYIEDKEVIPAAHTLTSVEAKDPTCTETGYEAYEYCTACDYTTYVEIPATGHVNTTTTTVDATCTADGSVTVTCDDCGAVISSETIEATGHNYVDGACSVCGEADPDYSTGVTVSGTAVSWNSTDDAIYMLYSSITEDATIKADWKAGTYETAIQTATKGGITNVTVDGKSMKSQTFTFEGVEAGTYKLVILKPGKYVPKIVEITVGTENVDVGQQKLWLYGDVTGDGKIRTGDATQIYKYLASARTFTDDEFAAADVTGDGKIRTGDATQMYKYLASGSSKFDEYK